MIREDKTRMNLTIRRDLKSKLEEIAEKEERSLNNLIVFILQTYVDGAGK